MSPTGDRYSLPLPARPALLCLGPLIAAVYLDCCFAAVLLLLLHLLLLLSLLLPLPSLPSLTGSLAALVRCAGSAALVQLLWFSCPGSAALADFCELL